MTRKDGHHPIIFMQADPCVIAWTRSPKRWAGFRPQGVAAICESYVVSATNRATIKGQSKIVSYDRNWPSREWEQGVSSCAIGFSEQSV